MNKLVYLGFSILEISKTSMLVWLNQCWYGYIKPQYQDNTKLCYRDTDSFIIVIEHQLFIKLLQMILENDMIHQIVKLIVHC